MSIVITVLHVVACFVLIVVVLLQTGKGADIGAVFGGSSQTIFGSSGAGNLLTRLTTWTAVIFMVTSLVLTWNSTHHLTSSIADTLPDDPPPLSAPLSGDAVPAAPADETGADGAAAPAPAGSDAAPAAEGAAQAPAVESGAPVEAAPADAAKPADDKSASAADATAPAAKPAEPAAPAPAQP